MSHAFFQGERKQFLWGFAPPGYGDKVVIARPTRDKVVIAKPTRLAQVRGSLLYLQRRVAKLASELLYSWSVLRNNNTAVNFQMFTSSYRSRRFAACDQGSHGEFFYPDFC